MGYDLYATYLKRLKNDTLSYKIQHIAQKLLAGRHNKIPIPRRPCSRGYDRRVRDLLALRRTDAQLLQRGRGEAAHHVRDALLVRVQVGLAVVGVDDAGTFLVLRKEIHSVKFVQQRFVAAYVYYYILGITIKL